MPFKAMIRCEACVRINGRADSDSCILNSRVKSSSPRRARPSPVLRKDVPIYARYVVRRPAIPSVSEVVVETTEQDDIALVDSHELHDIPLPDGVTAVRQPRAQHELMAVASIRAEAYYEEQPQSRYIETFKRSFTREEAGSLKLRTQEGPNGIPECVCLVALDDNNAVVGTLDIRPPANVAESTHLLKNGRFPNGVPESDPDGSYMLNVCVKEEKRGSGIGTLLLACACAEAINKWGAQRMYTEVDAWNDGAYSLYNRLGFQREDGDSSASRVGTRQRLMLRADLPLDCSANSTSISGDCFAS